MVAASQRLPSPVEVPRITTPPRESEAAANQMTAGQREAAELQQVVGNKGEARKTLQRFVANDAQLEIGGLTGTARTFAQENLDRRTAAYAAQQDHIPAAVREHSTAASLQTDAARSRVDSVSVNHHEEESIRKTMTMEGASNEQIEAHLARVRFKGRQSTPPDNIAPAVETTQRSATSPVEPAMSASTTEAAVTQSANETAMNASPQPATEKPKSAAQAVYDQQQRRIAAAADSTVAYGLRYSDDQLQNLADTGVILNNFDQDRLTNARMHRQAQNAAATSGSSAADHLNSTAGQFQTETLNRRGAARATQEAREPAAVTKFQVEASGLADAARAREAARENPTVRSQQEQANLQAEAARARQSTLPDRETAAAAPPLTPQEQMADAQRLALEMRNKSVDPNVIRQTVDQLGGYQYDPNSGILTNPDTSMPAIETGTTASNAETATVAGTPIVENSKIATETTPTTAEQLNITVQAAVEAAVTQAVAPLALEIATLNKLLAEKLTIAPAAPESTTQAQSTAIQTETAKTGTENPTAPKTDMEVLTGEMLALKQEMAKMAQKIAEIESGTAQMAQAVEPFLAELAKDNPVIADKLKKAGSEIAKLVLAFSLFSTFGVAAAVKKDRQARQ